MQNLRLRCAKAEAAVDDDDVAVVDEDDAAIAGGSPWGRQRRFQNNIL